MAKKKKYEENPYADTVVRAIECCVYDYGESKTALEKDPEDEVAKAVNDFCIGFIDWLQETTGIEGWDLLEVIMKMTEGENGKTV